nr:uncharacterized protein LOC109774688 [Aegilops tauschii subsp. strangulata]
MCEYTGDLKDPQRHIDIQLTEAEITEAAKKILDEPAAGDDPFWKKKLQDKPAKTPRVKTKVTKKPAKKKTADSTDLNFDDDDENHESEVGLDSLGSFFIHLIDNDYYQEDAEASQAGDVEGTSHSSSGESTKTQLPTLKTVPGAKPRPSKKAKLNKSAYDNPASEPEKTPEQFEPNADAILDDPPPQDHETFVEQMENDPTGHAVDPPTPAKAAELRKKSQSTDLQENIKSQQAETSKAKEELTSALAAMEKLKESFKRERAIWDTEKATLLKRAEDAEAALNPNLSLHITDKECPSSLPPDGS